MKHAAILILAGTLTLPSFAQTKDQKPEYTAPAGLTDSRLGELAAREIVARGRDKKCDHTQAYVMHTPSQRGEALVGFAAGAKRDAEGFLPLYCVVEIDALSGKIGKLRVFPDEEGNTLCVHLDDEGRVTGFKTQKPSRPPPAVTTPARKRPAEEVRSR